MWRGRLEVSNSMCSVRASTCSIISIVWRWGLGKITASRRVDVEDTLACYYCRFEQPRAEAYGWLELRLPMFVDQKFELISPASTMSTRTFQFQSCITLSGSKYLSCIAASTWAVLSLRDPLPIASCITYADNTSYLSDFNEYTFVRIEHSHPSNTFILPSAKKHAW